METPQQPGQQGTGPLSLFICLFSSLQAWFSSPPLWISLHNIDEALSPIVKLASIISAAVAIRYYLRKSTKTKPV